MLRAHRDELHAIRDRGQIPVLFGVHETVRRHTDIGMTRLFYAQSFDERWFQQMTPEDRRSYRTKLRFETTFARVVLDEVSPGDLVSIHRMADVRWVWEYQKIVEKIPESEKLARYHAFKKYRATHPRPRDDDDWADSEADWSYVNEILHANSGMSTDSIRQQAGIEDSADEPPRFGRQTYTKIPSESGP
jgi:hypothetical protein